MFPYEQYLRSDNLPHIWCTGCGCGIVMKAMLRAIHRSQLTKDSIALVSGIGCSSRTPGYVDFNTLHTTHGRAIAFASGIKLAKPALNIIVVTGDGDATAIGGNHFIHAARRNIAMTVLLYNNHTYGMTGGQTSPTTPIGMKGSMTPYGSIEPVFDISALAITAGASFVARSTCYHAVQLEKYIQRALANKGFSLVEVLSPCPTYYGRPNRLGTALDMMRWYKENSLPIEKARALPQEETKGKVVIGILHDVKRPEYSEEYYTLIRNIKKA